MSLLPLPDSEISDPEEYEDENFRRSPQTRSMSQQDSQDEQITAYFTSMSRETEINNYEFLMYIHENNIEDNLQTHKQDNDINLSDFLPEPTSLSQLLRLTGSVKNKWGGGHI